MQFQSIFLEQNTTTNISKHVQLTLLYI